MGYIIGIDLGINNVGWSIVSEDSRSLEKAGVRLFSPADGAADRRSFRGVKRRKKRKHTRVHDILNIFSSINFPNTNTIDTNILDKRVKGLHEKIDKQDIVNIACYLTTHRGYIPFGDEDRKLIDLKGMFPCEYYHDLLKEQGKYRALEEVIDHKDLVRELTAIFDKQESFYPELKKIRDDIFTVLSRKRAFWEGPGSVNSLTEYGRFTNKEDVINYQNDNQEWYLYDRLVAKCSVYPDEKVVCEGNYYYEVFNLLNDFINISIVSIDNLKEDANAFIKLDKDTNYYKINSLGLNKIIDYCRDNVNTKYDKLFKDIFGLKKEDITGYRKKKDLSPDFQTMPSFRAIKKAFLDYQNDWLEDIDQYNEFIRILAVTPGIVETKRMIEASNIIKVKFTSEEYELIKTLRDKLKSGNALRYGSFSQKLLMRAIDDMKSMEENYQQVSKKLKYDEEARKKMLESYSKGEKTLLIDKKYLDDIIASPQVKKSLRQAINVINAIILEKGEYPDVIAVESTKEVNSDEKRHQIDKEQKAFEKRNDEAREILASQFGDEFVTDINIFKTIAFNELNGICPYCNEPFEGGLNTIIRGNSEIEHILPLSKSFNDSFDNKTLACRKCNEAKGNNSPALWMGLKSDKFKEFSERIIRLPISDEKKANFLETRDLTKYNTRFFNRNLRDTAYATKELINQIKLFNDVLHSKDEKNPMINTLSTPGQLTGKIRKNLNLDKDRDDGKYHHAVDATIVAGIALDGGLGKILIESQNNSQFWITKKQLDAKIPDMIRNFNMAYFKDNLEKIKSDDDIKISDQVIKDPNRSIANANVYKFLNLDGQFYKVEQISNIYDSNIKLDLLDKLFTDKGETLMIQDNNPKMYEKLKEIYLTYKDKGTSKNPFLNYCLEVNDISDKEFDYLIHGIKEENGPVIKRLRYYSKVTNPSLIQKDNIKMKNSTYIGMDSVSQAYTQIYWDNDDHKFIFFPIYLTSINFKDNSINKNDRTYKLYYDLLLKDKNITFVVNLYNGNLIEVAKKNGNVIKGRVSGYDKSGERIELKKNKKIETKKIFTMSDSQLKVYDTDYLGNEKLRLTWPQN